MGVKSDIEIAQEAQMLDIREVAAKVGVAEDDLELYGKYKAKISDDLYSKLEDKKVRGILNWIFQIAVVLIFGILAGIALFQSVTVQESAMEPTLQVGERFFVNRAVYKVSSPERGDIIVYKTSGSDECLWKAVSILYLAITEITVRTAGMVISEISIRNILWERYGLSFPRKINLDF